MKESKIIEFESRIAFQDDTIQKLSDVVYAQQKQIDRLSSICDQLKSQVSEVRESLSADDFPVEKPPHY